jgi:hypothetical protein
VARTCSSLLIRLHGLVLIHRGNFALKPESIGAYQFFFAKYGLFALSFYFILFCFFLSFKAETGKPVDSDLLGFDPV